MRGDPRRVAARAAGPRRPVAAPRHGRRRGPHRHDGLPAAERGAQDAGDPGRRRDGRVRAGRAAGRLPGAGLVAGRARQRGAGAGEGAGPDGAGAAADAGREGGRGGGRTAGPAPGAGGGVAGGGAAGGLRRERANPGSGAAGCRCAHPCRLGVPPRPFRHWGRHDCPQLGGRGDCPQLGGYGWQPRTARRGRVGGCPPAAVGASTPERSVAHRFRAVPRTDTPRRGPDPPPTHRATRTPTAPAHAPQANAPPPTPHRRRRHRHRGSGRPPIQSWTMRRGPDQRRSWR